jgi:hypothetical protein
LELGWVSAVDSCEQTTTKTKGKPVETYNLDDPPQTPQPPPRKRIRATVAPQPPAPPASPKFRRPRLSVLFELVGLLILLLASVPALLGTFALLASTTGNDVSAWQGGLIAFGVAIAIGVVALLFYGMAQIITATMETAFNTRRTTNP